MTDLIEVKTADIVDDQLAWVIGATPLIAICRAVITKITGWTVQVPKELMS